MRDKKNYYQKYRRYYIWEGLLLSGWGINFMFFSKFYEHAVFYIDKKDKFIIQLLFLMNYYLQDILKYLLIGFVLMTLNVLLVLMFYIQNKRGDIKKKEMNGSMIAFLLGIIVNGIALMRTIIWPLFLVLFIASLTIVYIIYVITTYLYEDKDEFYEDNEQVKIEAHFQTKEDAEKYAKEFMAHWNDYFEKKGYRLVNHVKYDGKNQWHVEFVVQSMK
ncbi:hypothetical protein ACWOC1_02065 [Enterococcus quebecensis]|uniref:Uncharacterized protein n=1 Tax=Enterococcus quebecensis TaxID=903983 RepID=A0A1E5H3B4_9ENTE|nr:hypothetical protein [Enterococcus quebecensis]OEG19393.1 hypothetical protein BCR23_01520 [Enterococcus quebecensis]